VYLLIAIGLATAYVLLKPLSDGLLDTSMWVAKILAPTTTQDNDITKQFLKIQQAALMEGWLSNIPFITTILGLSCIIAGFIHAWWGGILMFLVLAIGAALTKILWTRSVSYYLPLIYHKMTNRAADYRMKNDLERLEAAQSVCKDLELIILTYQTSRLRPPTDKQLRYIPYGDFYYWLESKASS